MRTAPPFFLFFVLMAGVAPPGAVAPPSDPVSYTQYYAEILVHYAVEDVDYMRRHAYDLALDAYPPLRSGALCAIGARDDLTTEGYDCLVRGVRESRENATADLFAVLAGPDDLVYDASRVAGAYLDAMEGYLLP